jgi:dihydrodiol dehydrogenase / D-xylose 1-dehydrogenase (NADP)
MDGDIKMDNSTAGRGVAAYRWGIIGAGWMARMMADDLALSPRGIIHAVASRSPSSAEDFGKEYHVEKIYPVDQELVHDPEVDVVYISSPHNAHFANAALALEAGKAVLLEKPFTVNAKEAEKLIDLARAGSIFLMEAMWIRFLPIIRELRKVLDEGTIGEIRLFKAAFHQLLDYGPEHRLYNPNLAGGSLLDLGIYPISLASFVFGEPPNEIVSIPFIGATGVDEHFGAVFHYPGRRMALVSAGADGFHPQDIQIFGSKGEIRISGHKSWKLDHMTLTIYGESIKEFYQPFEGGGYLFQAEEVHNCLDSGQTESGGMPLEETIIIMQTLDRLRGQWGLKYPMESE